MISQPKGFKGLIAWERFSHSNQHFSQYEIRTPDITILIDLGENSSIPGAINFLREMHYASCQKDLNMSLLGKDI